MISPRRIAVLAVLFAAAVLAVIARAAQIQIFESPALASRGAFQQTAVYFSQAPRGVIFDRHGNILATSQPAYIVRVDPRTITDTDTCAYVVAQALAKPVEETRQRIQTIVESSKTSTSTYTILYYNVSPQAVTVLTSTLSRFEREGIVVIPTWARVYPQGPVAGPLLGFVSLQLVGFAGVESFYDRELSAQGGVRQERTQLDLTVITPTQPAADVVLTIDIALQSYVEKQLSAALTEYEAQGGAIIVMDTRSGAILAAASAPGYDPNFAIDIANSEDADRLIDPAVSAPYEPGSVIKAVTIAAALDAGTATTATLYQDSGRFVVAGKTIRNSDRAAHGQVDIEDTLARSLNVVAAQIAFDLGPERFYHYFNLFGFGRRTGIDLGNESTGLLRTPTQHTDWSKADLATNSFGQGMMATPYQVINALNVIANDGLLMQPYVVWQQRKADGAIVTKKPTPVAQVISPGTARLMREVMQRATRQATPQAVPTGYTVAGKTGTADWYLRGVKQDTTIVTFVGFLPALEPRLTILVKLDQPKKSRWAAYTAAPVFQNVAGYAARLMGVPPDIQK
ncbi:MAG: penicillin-binding protein 2 [Anaerolineae bacterium]|nr:penicillin-binding protein 2 [Thermoflexales bacterium]MDW8406698.1 penicillin-binding protein 2 [Anaerolineae bacterium]